jgi:hypothetical protein
MDEYDEYQLVSSPSACMVEESGKGCVKMTGTIHHAFLPITPTSSYNTSLRRSLIWSLFRRFYHRMNHCTFSP